MIQAYTSLLCTQVSSVNRVRNVQRLAVHPEGENEIIASKDLKLFTAPLPSKRADLQPKMASVKSSWRLKRSSLPSCALDLVWPLQHTLGLYEFKRCSQPSPASSSRSSSGLRLDAELS